MEPSLQFWLSMFIVNASGQVMAHETFINNLEYYHHALQLVYPKETMSAILNFGFSPDATPDVSHKPLKRHLHFTAGDNSKFCCFFKNNK